MFKNYYRIGGLNSWAGLATGVVTHPQNTRSFHTLDQYALPELGVSMLNNVATIYEQCRLNMFKFPECFTAGVSCSKQSQQQLLMKFNQAELFKF